MGESVLPHANAAAAVAGSFKIYNELKSNAAR
jgi:hypothetical protein